MRAFFQHPTVRRARILFRWCRITLWLILFVALAAISYLHLVGLPDFLKQPMLARLLEKGIAAQFSNIQLGWGRGPLIIIEDAAFSRSDQPLSPRLSAKRAELALNWDALRHARIEARSLQVAGAQLQIPVSGTNSDALLLNNVAVDLQFFTNDFVRLNYCRGAFHGVQLDIIGAVRHASDLSHWKFPTVGNNPGAFQARLQQVAQTVQEIHFTGKPLLEIEAGADGRDMNSFHVELDLVAPAAHTPWGDVSNLTLYAACARLSDPGAKPFLHLTCSAARLATPWASGRKVSCMTIVSRGANSNLDAEIRFDADQCNTDWKSAGNVWFRAGHLSWNGSATLASSNYMPLLAAGKLSVDEPQTPWGSAHELSLECRATRAANLPPTEAGWGPWTNITPWILDWQTEMRNVTNPKLHLDRLALSGHWRAPQVVIENLRGELSGGQANAAAILDIGSRELRCNGSTDFDPHAISQMLHPAASNWLAQLDWTPPPKVNASLRVVLPPWTNRPFASADMSSTLQIAGDFTMGSASFRKAQVSSAKAHVAFTNGIWSVSHLRAVRPDGDVDLDYASSLQTQDYRMVIDSRLDPTGVLPLLAPGQERALNAWGLTFKQSPVIHAEILGRWNAPERTGVTATVLATNFLARGETVAAFRAGVNYTNQVLTVTRLSLSNDQCQVRVPWAQADFRTTMVQVTNVAGMVDPSLLQRVLRKNAPPWLNDLHFGAPPSVTASGDFSYTNQLAMNLHFLVGGQGVHYNRLAADTATGRVDWTGQTISITNIDASLYEGGALTGWLAFYPNPNHGSDLAADFNATNLDLSSFVAGLSGKTNRLEGRLDTDLTFSGPNTSDISNWQGRGRVHVRDAQLWEIKVFSLLSPVLSVISADWGRGRTHVADAHFIFTNGTISSDDLVMQYTGFVLKVHKGSMDKNKQIKARLEAIVSQKTPVLGTVVGLFFTPLSKLFEYDISGPWDAPVLKPVYIPQYIMYLLHPFKSLKPSTPPESPIPPETTAPPPAPQDPK